MRDSVRYQRELDTATKFRDAFEAYTETLTYASDGTGLIGQWIEKLGSEADAERLREELDRMAGQLGPVVQREGLMMAVAPPRMVGGPTRLMNLVLNWSNPYDPGSDTRVSDVRSVIDRMIGILEQRREESLEVEHSLAGRIARVLRFPVEVRSAVGLAPNTAAGRAVSWGVGIAQSLIAGVILVGVSWLVAKIV